MAFLLPDDLFSWSLLSMRTWTLLTAALYLTWRVWSFTLVPRLYPDRPKFLPYWIPLVGHTVAFFRSADRTLSCGSEYFNGSRSPFAISVGGETIYVVTSPEDATVVLKNIESLTFDEYIRDMMLRFGTTPNGVKQMWKSATNELASNPRCVPNAQRKALVHLTEFIHRQQLYPGNRYELLQSILVENIDHAVQWSQISESAIVSRMAGSYTVSLLDWCRGILLDCATRTFFGDRLQEIEPAIFRHFRNFDDNSWLFTYKIPHYWSKDMYAAKKKVQDALEVYFSLPERERPGEAWIIRTLETEMRARGINTPDIAALLNMIFWVINTNAYKLCFWIMAYLLHNPSLLKAVQSEVTSAVTNSISTKDLLERLDKCKRLDSVYNETLRLISSSMAIRNVSSPMLVGGKLMRAGTKIIIPFRQMHLSKKAWGLDAESFDPDRFLNFDSQRNANFRPFGGGITHCPGRFAARHEILSFIAFTLTRFDLGLSDQNTEFPKIESGRPCLGMMSPAEGQDVLVRMAPLKS